jgi:alpha-L-fucosidase 2
VIDVACGAISMTLLTPPALPLALLAVEQPAGSQTRIALDRPPPRQDRYPPPVHGGDANSIWLEQQLPAAPLYRMGAFPLEGTVRREETELVIEGPHAVLALGVVTGPTQKAFEQLRNELCARGTATPAAENREWWAAFWQRSFVRYPDPIATNLWYLGLYLLGCSSRKPGCPPNLQGIWSDWDVPPWHADYHHDLNTQLTYWGIDAANHSDLGSVFYDFWKGLLPEIKAHTGKYYGLPGIRIPATSDPKARELGGFFPVALWVGSSAWVAYHYWLRYEHTLDETFLRDTCYPMLREQARFCAAYLERDATGKLRIFPSHSPEQGGNSTDAIGANSTMDLWLFATVLQCAASAAEILDTEPDERETWRTLADELPDFPEEDGVWIDMEGRRYRAAHRHLSVLTPIYPGKEFSRHSDPRDLELPRRSYREFISRPDFGNLRGDYCHFTPLWLSLVALRLGLADEAADWLQRFLGEFVLPNGLAVVRPSEVHGSTVFQMDSNGGHVAAVNEALVQSHSGIIDLFPGIGAGQEASFYSLRAQGAVLVSAARTQAGVQWAHFHAEKGGPIRVYNPWPDHASTLNGVVGEISGDSVFYWEAKPGSDWVLLPEGGSFTPLAGVSRTEPGLLWRELHA